MRKRIYLVVGVVTLLALLATALAVTSFDASAGRSGVFDDGKELLPKASISLDQAIAAAQKAASGPVDEVDLEYYSGKLVFNVDVGSKDVKVDATTGVVLSTDLDD
jgi:uncharacterized membrane protein YkoI